MNFILLEKTKNITSEVELEVTQGTRTSAKTKRSLSHMPAERQILVTAQYLRYYFDAVYMNVYDLYSSIYVYVYVEFPHKSKV